MKNKEDVYNIEIVGKDGFERYNNVEEQIILPIREMIKNKHNVKEVEIRYKEDPNE